MGSSVRLIWFREFDPSAALRYNVSSKSLLNIDPEGEFPGCDDGSSKSEKDSSTERRLRRLHIAFWEPHFAAEFPSLDDWKAQTHRLGARLHLLTIEQNALTSFRSRTTLVPAFANTIGPGLFLEADRIIGGADGIFDRGMQWQGTSLWMTLRYGPDPWVPSSFMPTLGGRLFYHKDLAGPLVPELN